MVSEIVLVPVKRVMIMNCVWNIKDSKTSLGWGVFMDGKNCNILCGVRRMTRYGKIMPNARGCSIGQNIE